MTHDFFLFNAYFGIFVGTITILVAVWYRDWWLLLAVPLGTVLLFFVLTGTQRKDEAKHLQTINTE